MSIVKYHREIRRVQKKQRPSKPFPSEVKQSPVIVHGDSLELRPSQVVALRTALEQAQSAPSSDMVELEPWQIIAAWEALSEQSVPEEKEYDANWRFTHRQNWMTTLFLVFTFLIAWTPTVGAELPRASSTGGNSKPKRAKKVDTVSVEVPAAGEHMVGGVTGTSSFFHTVPGSICQGEITVVGKPVKVTCGPNAARFYREQPEQYVKDAGEIKNLFAGVTQRKVTRCKAELVTSIMPDFHVEMEMPGQIIGEEGHSGEAMFSVRESRMTMSVGIRFSDEARNTLRHELQHAHRAAGHVAEGIPEAHPWAGERNGPGKQEYGNAILADFERINNNLALLVQEDPKTLTGEKLRTYRALEAVTRNYKAHEFVREMTDQQFAAHMAAGDLDKNYNLIRGVIVRDDARFPNMPFHITSVRPVPEYRRRPGVNYECVFTSILDAANKAKAAVFDALRIFLEVRDSVSSGALFDEWDANWHAAFDPYPGLHAFLFSNQAKYDNEHADASFTACMRG